MKRKSIILQCCLVATLLFFHLTVLASLFPFTATYSGSQEVPVNNSPATGTITGVYNDVTNTIYYRITFNGLMTNTVAGHFHAPAPAGTNAGVIHHHEGLPIGVMNGNFVSSNVFTATQEDQLKAGLVYSNIHTTGIPSGEIRAQIILGPASSSIYTFNRTYSGTQEVPPNTSPATGNISGVYVAGTNTILYRIVFAGLQTPTVAAHFHAAAPVGVNAPVIHHHEGFPTSVTSGVYNGSNLFTDGQEASLFSNLVYSNIHTVSLPGGEIRAQIILDGAPGVICPPNIVSGTDPGLCTALEGFAVSTTGFPSPVVTYFANNALITLPFAFPVGTTTVTAVVTNAAGMASCNFTVTVNDTEAPVISGMNATPNELWPPNNKMRDVRINYNRADNCGNPVSCLLTVTSNEGGSGDWAIVDDHNLKLRAKRAGNGNGRIYTITVICSDAAGNATPTSTIVTVPHDTGNRSGGNGDIVSGDNLEVKVLSNPTTTSFKVNVISADINGLIQLRLYNLSGVLVDSKNNVRNSEPITIGASLRPGVYMLEVRQGEVIKKVKLLKQ